jgi:aspartokinase/homoserine dehydrogenase 1
MTTNRKVHKFGGTSLADALCFGRVADILTKSSSDAERLFVVVSAMSKTTDALINLIVTAQRQDGAYVRGVEAIRERHISTLNSFAISTEEREEIARTIVADCSTIGDILKGISLARSYSEQLVELISGFGELWSARMLAALLRSRSVAADWLDAREVLTVESAGKSVAVDWQKSKHSLARFLESHDARVTVITGYIASTPEGIPTTLKRNGSDYSASIFGALLDADEITIWTDVDGVFSADPRLVPDAVLASELSYQEASELAYFGAKVVHPSTMAPAINKGIPIWIRNTFRPEIRGTRISRAISADKAVKGFATIEKMALVNLEGTGMIGVPGVSYRLFGALKEADVSVVMISQASSEHSICFAVPEHEADKVRKTVENAFFAELHRGQIQSIDVIKGCCIIAAVGDGMVEKPGVASKFFSALAQAGINIRAIAQGSSERNISAVISQSSAERALRAVHSAFYLSPQTISLGLIGAGLIGKTFLNQLAQRLELLKSERGIDVRIRAIANSQKMLLAENAIDPSDWENQLKASDVAFGSEVFAHHVATGHLPHSVIIDATASASLPDYYPDWLSQGINIITPNKKGNSESAGLYARVKDAARSNGKYYLYETTVGAGLPVLHTLRDLRETGDEILKIEGVLSGTLSYIFNTYDGTRPFSDILADARLRGFTEPDPRDDLSGMDVARKLTILAREMGVAIDTSDIEVENLVPQTLLDGRVEDFLSGMKEFDSAMANKLSQARVEENVLRYTGEVNSDGKAIVRLGTFSRSHPFASLSGSDNIIMFTTARYNVQPMIVRGPGAGPEVTAAGVFADLLRLASFLGARQ